MRKNNIPLVYLKLKSTSIIIGLLVFFISWSTNLLSQTDKNENKANSDIEILWHIKAIHPDGKFIDVKAFDKKGNIYDVKGIQNSELTTIMDIKALVDGEKVPIKILLSDDKFSQVKAIKEDGTILDIITSYFSSS